MKILIFEKPLTDDDRDELRRKAEQEGAEVRLSGHNAGNPYPFGTPEHRAWQHGFEIGLGAFPKARPRPAAV